MAKYLQLPLTATPPLQVTVGNGTTIPCNQLCQRTALQIQGQTFYVDLHVLPISGADIVLGVQWLRQLGPILTNYDNLTMQFRYQDDSVTLRADAIPPITNTSTLQLRRLIQTHSAVAFFHISISTNTPQTLATPPPHPIPEINLILQQYRHPFATPTSLPPPRTITHQIHLLPNTEPINTRPYRYPHFQKSEIEKKVHDMLSTGLIQLSHSPFSSPVLLVKKKDGSWRFCVDYRALNAVTVKDHFPMPTIDELLDELGTAT